MNGVHLENIEQEKDLGVVMSNYLKPSKQSPTLSLLEVPADKCVYEGREYALGEAVEVDPCSADCHCRPSQDNRPRVTRAHIECPDLFVPRKPNCRPIYELDKCCSVDEECLEPGTPQVAQPRGVTCLWKNQSYKEGDKMYFDGQFACRQCVCTAEFSDPTGPGCKDVFCGIELRYMDRVTAGCTPINFEDGCCPIGWLCPEDAGKLQVHGTTETGKHPGRCPGRTRSEAPSFGICAFTCNEDGDCPHGEMCCSTACGGTSCVAPVHDDPVESGKACHLGDLTVPLGGTVTDKEDCTTRCSCSAPPLLTCTKYRSCELAEERYKDCHDVVCQPGCDLRVNSTTLCNDCHCPDETSASPRCPEIRCPHACRSTNLKKDPVTGCFSCRCDTCPPKDPITGQPPCPIDCAIEVMQDPETGCDVCRCRDTTLPRAPPPTQCPRLSPGGQLPCPSDCPAGTHTAKDTETHCLKCACAAPSNGKTTTTTTGIST
ncbi:uncharacterized protein LOC143032074 [Oratosquilla oratoria]|uniref:uncharacterized protein LOC143032074 n=1 Tax=Oratosquilla oratoria TaxID=337810 RepID=UPI003F7648CF